MSEKIKLELPATRRYEVHAFLRLLTPMHIAFPSEAKVSSKTLKRAGFSDPGAIPLTTVQRLQVPVLKPVVESPADQSEQVAQMAPIRPSYNEYVPVIAANNLAGRLRRHGAAEVLDVLRQKGQKVTIQTYSALACGAVNGNPDAKDPLFAEIMEARAHPYIGLFGGGPRMMRRYLRVHNAVPYTEVTKFMFDRLRHPKLDDETHMTKATWLTQNWLLNRNDDLIDLVNLAQQQASIENYVEAIQQRQSAVVDGKAKDEQEKTTAGGAKRESTRSFTAIEFVVPGVIFPIRMELDVTQAQLGLFLKTLGRFVETERIGGFVRNGFGLFSLDDVHLVDVSETDESKRLHKVMDNNKLITTSDFMKQVLGEWETAAKELNADDLNRLFKPSPEAPKKKADKSAQDAERVQ